MGYNIEISVNMLKETKFSEYESIIQETADLYGCESIHSVYEEDGTNKIPRYHCVFVINFLDETFDNFIKFIKVIKNYKKGYIECIYVTDKYKILYASAYYLHNMDKEATNKYKQFINEKKFTPKESIILQEFKKL
jgi:hypothetical protein